MFAKILIFTIYYDYIPNNVKYLKQIFIVISKYLRLPKCKKQGIDSRFLTIGCYTNEEFSFEKLKSF